MTQKIRVLIVDDQPLIREGLEMILSIPTHIQVVGSAQNGKMALKQIPELNPDVVLLDIRMPEMDGVQTTKEIKEHYPQCKVIILTTFNEDEYIFEALNNGANGYLLKDVKSDEIIRGIERVVQGDTPLEPKVATKVVQALTYKHKSSDSSLESTLATLTPRELEIAQLVGQGMSNKEIADQLFITEGTVKNHLTRILSKLELRDRVQLALFLKES